MYKESIQYLKNEVEENVYHMHYEDGKSLNIEIVVQQLVAEFGTDTVD